MLSVRLDKLLYGWRTCDTAVSTSALILLEQEERLDFILLYKVDLIGCGRLIKSLTLELRWEVKAGDKDIDEEGWDFFVCLCMCECGCASFGSYSIYSQGTKGRTGLGLQRLNSVSLSLTENHFLYRKSLRRMWEGCRHEPRQGEDERDNVRKKNHFLDDTLLERWSWPPNVIETSLSWHQCNGSKIGLVLVLLFHADNKHRHHKT